MASLGYRRGGWELRYRDRRGRQRVERIAVRRCGGRRRRRWTARRRWSATCGTGATCAGGAGSHLRRLLRALGPVPPDRVIEDPCIDIVLPKKPDRRKTFDDVLSAAEVDALVAALVDPDPRYAGLRTNSRYAALVFMGAWLGPR